MQINPLADLLEVALYWAEFENGNFDEAAFYAVIKSYIEKGGIIGDDFADVLYVIFKGKLEWLEYNMKRSLFREYSDEKEQRLGTEQVTNTFVAIKHYEEQIPLILKLLKKI